MEQDKKVVGEKIDTVGEIVKILKKLDPDTLIDINGKDSVTLTTWYDDSIEDSILRIEEKML